MDANSNSRLLFIHPKNPKHSFFCQYGSNFNQDQTIGFLVKRLEQERNAQERYQHNQFLQDNASRLEKSKQNYQQVNLTLIVWL